MILSQPLIKGVITAEIKIDENASETLDQDPKDVVSHVTSKAHNVVKSRGSISDPTTTKKIVTIRIDAFHQSP